MDGNHDLLRGCWLRRADSSRTTCADSDLATLLKDQVVDQLRRNHQFLMKTYGVDPRPYYRPPYGSHNPAVDAVAAELGYSVPTMWCGSLEDQNVIPEDEIVKHGQQRLRPAGHRDRSSHTIYRSRTSTTSWSM